MQYSFRRLSSYTLFKVLFQLIFWFFWLFLPLLNAHFDGDSERFSYLKQLLPLGVFCIPFFYFNSEFLINKFLPKNQIGAYVVSLLVLFLIFLFSYYLYKDYLIDLHPVRFYDARTFFPALFIISMSTLYGFIVFMTKQSQKNAEQKAQRLQSELSFLRSQISPHFIFNLLNSIVYLIRTKNPLAEHVTIELSELIRYMLYDADHQHVTVERELEYLNNYIELQKIRFGEDVQISLNIEGDFSGKYIEPMLLIPFVENAFKHGIGMIENPVIEIIAKCAGNNFSYSVKNKVENSNQTQNNKNSGIGIKNVKRRIELLYPNKHIFEIKRENNYFESKLTLELKTNGTEN